MKLPTGLSEQVVRQISAIKHEPDWMLDIRLDAYQEFCRLPLPSSGPDLSAIPFDKLCYFNTPVKAPAERWQKVPAEIKKIYQQIGLPEAEQRYLAGAQAQYNSGMVYEKLRDQWVSSGIIFTDTDTAVQKYPELVKQYFGRVVDYHNNKLAALNTAVWSGGSFIYIPPFRPVLADVPDNTGKAGELERDNPVLQHISKYRPYDDTRILRKEEGTLVVHFPLDKADLRLDFRDNGPTLDRIACVADMPAAPDIIRVKDIQTGNLTAFFIVSNAGKRLFPEKFVSGFRRQ